MDGTEVMAHVAELPGLGIRRIVGAVDGWCGPDADVTICARYSFSREHRIERRGYHLPPPAVASLEPSGETWQL